MSRLLFGIVILAATMAVNAAIPTDAGSEATMTRSEDVVLIHLEPMTRQDFESFRARKRERGCVMSFDEMASFRPSRHWCIAERNNVFTIVLWESSDGIGARTSARQLKSRAVPDSVAQQIRRIWFLAILNARYAPVRILGTDGVHFYFGVKRYTLFDFLEVHAWNPMGDYPPKWIANLGTRVFEVAMVEALNDAALSKELEEVLDRLERFYPESQ